MSRGGRTSVRFFDPTGARFTRPTYPWQMAPEGLATARQLRAQGLRPGGQDIAAQILWRGIGGVRTAYLYRVELARPKRTATPAQRVALAGALEARQVCPVCHVLRGYVIPRAYGQCLTCAGEVPRARVGRVRTRAGQVVHQVAEGVAA
ncbi:MAG TPA: RRQRL motif-containing zinc-binding protein [Mycobacteriales bacterium]|nr:RRQRL motif-containing zinc-binding protein [Mycobacteriales bacterium]